jgi:ketosteroid isomerase-like protein
MSRENVALVRRTLGAFMSTGEPAWEAMDDKIECYDHDVPEGGHHRGHEGFVRFVENWSEAWAEWSLDVQEYLDAGDSVVVFVRMKARGQSGIELERDDAIVYRVDGDRIVRIDYYNNRPEALEAVGLSE